MTFAPDLLRNKRVLITGGATGLGRAMALRVAQLGAAPVIVGRRADKLAEAAAMIEAATGTPAETAILDQRDPEEVEKVFDALCSRGPIDALVNNAAANFVARSETLSHRAVDAVLQTSLHGAAYCTLAAGRRWLAQGHRPAVILSIVTSYAWHGSPYVVPSAMAKAGVMAMTRSLATEWGPHGIRLVAIAPGSFPTPGAWERLVPRADLAAIHEHSNSVGRPGDPAELADLAAFLLSDAAGYIHGECVTIDGGRWLKGAGTFSFLADLDDDDWKAMRSDGRNPGKPSE